MAKGKHEGNETAPRKLLFVRNLPFSTTSKQLEELFSDDAPIKQAFVVKDKDNHHKCRGFGYVQFVLQEDADKAIQSTKSFGDRKLVLCYANKKPKHEKRKREKQLNEEKTTEGDDVDEEKVEETDEQEQTKEDTNVQNNQKQGAPKKHVKSEETASKTDNKSDLQRTIVITGLTSKVKRKAFRILCEKFGEVENIVYPVPERSEVTAFVRFKDYKSTIRALQKIPGQKVKKSNALSVVLLTKEGKFPSKKLLDKARLIVRNLSFQVDENELKECFAKFGHVLQVNIPTKIVNKKPVKIGCGFVQFENPAYGKVALEAMNMKEIKGRTVIVDWAVKKEDYVADKTTKKQVPPKSKKVKKEENENDGVSDGDDDDDVSDDNEADNNDEDGDESVEGSSDAEGEEESDEEQSEGEQEMESDDEDVDDDEDISDDDEDNDEVDEAREAREARMKEKMKDAKEGKTVFIRNMSYNTDDESLMEEFEKYGEIEYCRIVMDRETGHSKGCAFLKFKEKESADECIKEFEKLQSEDKNKVIDGRSIVVSKAVTRGKMGEIEKQKAAEKQETDKRNLYLAYEGMITRKTPGAESLSEQDLKLREKALAEKKAKLKNAQYFVSRTRLCVRNIPLTCEANELQKAFLKASNVNTLKITDTKIMRSKDRKDENGAYRSLGYGFLEVNNHENALKLLRATNNNPEIFGEKRRPIVEFSVENSKALKILEAKKQKLEQMKKQKSETVTTETKDFIVAKHRQYKEKAKDKRHKRAVRYQKKREEKRKLREATEAKNEQQQITKKRKDFAKNRKEKPQTYVKKPVVKTTENKRKRPIEKEEIQGPDEVNRKRSRKMNTMQRRIEETKFESMVSKYKNKLNNSVVIKNKTKKDTDKRWFDE